LVAVTTQPALLQSPNPALEAGGALALLVDPAPTHARGRDEAATRLLRRVTRDDGLTVSRRDSGRPRLSPPYCELGVAMSTCRDALLIGFHPDRPVGVDLEAEGSLDVEAIDQIARDQFTPQDAAAIAAAPIEHRCALFLCHWTAKEAALKVTGRGVYDGLRWPSIDVVAPPHGFEPAHVEVAASAAVGRLRISVRRISLASAGTALAALCVAT
jgi:4'-phosphopantetheinyl transferase